MSDEESPVPEEVLTSAKDQLDDEEISLADNEEILHALSELTPVYENDRSYFVLGNYDREPIRRLNSWSTASTGDKMPTHSGWSISAASGTIASRSSA